MSSNEYNSNEHEHQYETDEERRMRRNLRLSIDNPDFSRHHFYDSPVRTVSDRNGHSPLRIRKMSLSSIADDDDDENGEGDERVLLQNDKQQEDTALRLSNSVTFLNAECPRWRKLMERVSIADSVLTRVICL